MTEREIWDGIEADYLTGQMSVQEIAGKWGKSASTIYKKATSQGWKKKLAKIRQKADEKVIARRARARARELEDMYEATQSMSRLLKRTVEAMNGEPMEKVIRSLKGVSALASAMDTNVRTLMTLHGIQTPAQVEAQRIARERLGIEKRRQQLEESRSDQGSGTQQVELVIKKEKDEPDEQIDKIKRICTDPEADA